MDLNELQKNLIKSRTVIHLSSIILIPKTSGCILHLLVLMMIFYPSALRLCSPGFPDPREYIICIQLYSLDNHIAQNQMLIFSVFMHSSWPIFHVDLHARENLTLKFGDICCKQSAAYYTETEVIIPSH